MPKFKTKESMLGSIVKEHFRELSREEQSVDDHTVISVDNEVDRQF